MLRRPPRSTLFPYTTLFRSPAARDLLRLLLEVQQMPVEDFPYNPEFGEPYNSRERFFVQRLGKTDRKSTRLNSSHSQISYAVFCLKKKKKKNTNTTSQHNQL